MLLPVAMVTVNVTIWFGDIANILLVAVVLFAAVLLLCGGRMFARFSIALLLFSLIISSSAVLTHLRPPLDEYLWVFSTLLWFCIFLFVRRFVAPDAVKTIGPRLWLLLDVLALLPFLVTTIIVVFTQSTRMFVTDDPHTDMLVIGNERVLLILLALSALYSVVLLLSVALLARQEKLEQQQMLWTIRQQHYVNLEQNQLQVRRLRHDMANHLNAMAGMDDRTLRDYLSQLAATPAMEAGRRFCENEIVNAVLSAKQPMVEQEGIQAEIRVDVPAAMPVSDIDMCAIFSNCIDNAIEACRRCPPAERSMALTARTEKGIFTLRLENSMAGLLESAGGVLATTKPDKENHGLAWRKYRISCSSTTGYCGMGKRTACSRCS